MFFKNNKKIPDIKIINLKKFNDKRGKFYEIFNKRKYSFNKINFPQSNISISKWNVLRGLHYQIKKPIGYIITVIEGAIYDVAVDLRKTSKTFGLSTAIKLSDKSDIQIYIPPGFAHGFCCLSKKCILHYYCTSTYRPRDENGIIWNDKKLNISWPVKKPILNSRDKNFKTFDEIKKNKLPKNYEV